MKTAKRTFSAMGGAALILSLSACGGSEDVTAGELEDMFDEVDGWEDADCESGIDLVHEEEATCEVNEEGQPSDITLTYNSNRHGVDLQGEGWSDWMSFEEEGIEPTEDYVEQDNSGHTGEEDI